MKHFKPELLIRYRSSDDTVADAAANEWDSAIVAYRTRFLHIRGQLPAGVRRFCSKVTLHDSRVLGAAWSDQKPHFVILLQLEGSGGENREVLELNYHPVSGPKGGVVIHKHALSEKMTQRNVRVLYDEFDLDEANNFFTHCLLLSDGREIEIRFHSLMVRHLDHVFTPPELTEQKVQWLVAEPVR